MADEGNLPIWNSCFVVFFSGWLYEFIGIAVKTIFFLQSIWIDRFKNNYKVISFPNITLVLTRNRQWPDFNIQITPVFMMGHKINLKLHWNLLTTFKPTLIWSVGIKMSSIVVRRFSSLMLNIPNKSAFISIHLLKILECTEIFYYNLCFVLMALFKTSASRKYLYKYYFCCISVMQWCHFKHRVWIIRTLFIHTTTRYRFTQVAVKAAVCVHVVLNEFSTFPLSCCYSPAGNTFIDTCEWVTYVYVICTHVSSKNNILFLRFVIFLRNKFTIDFLIKLTDETRVRCRSRLNLPCV